MSVVLLIVGLVVLAAMAYAATGRGGELSAERADHAPLDLGPVTATDVVLLRPPSAVWGYDMQATDEALERIAETIRERDVRIVALEQLVTDLSHDPAPAPLGSPFAGARHRRAAEPPARAEAPSVPGTLSVPETLAAAPIPDPEQAPPAWPQSPARPPQAETRPQPEARPEQREEQRETRQQEQQRQRQPPPERSHG